jgi:hypothetical protein
VVLLKVQVVLDFVLCQIPNSYQCFERLVSSSSLTACSRM